jgi:hypothetical protein
MKDPIAHGQTIRPSAPHLASLLLQLGSAPDIAGVVGLARQRLLCGVSFANRCVSPASLSNAHSGHRHSWGLLAIQISGLSTPCAPPPQQDRETVPITVEAHIDRKREGGSCRAAISRLDDPCAMIRYPSRSSVPRLDIVTRNAPRDTEPECATDERFRAPEIQAELNSSTGLQANLCVYIGSGVALIVASAHMSSGNRSSALNSKLGRRRTALTNFPSTAVRASASHAQPTDGCFRTASSPDPRGGAHGRSRHIVTAFSRTVYFAMR